MEQKMDPKDRERAIALLMMLREFLACGEAEALEMAGRIVDAAVKIA